MPYYYACRTYHGEIDNHHAYDITPYTYIDDVKCLDIIHITPRRSFTDDIFRLSWDIEVSRYCFDMIAASPAYLLSPL